MDANSQIGFALNHIANFNAAMVQMNLHRFWAETLAQPRYADPKRLLRHGFKVYSQHDEDGIIQEIFRRIGTSNRTFVEFGVETGVECNTAKLLIEGWRGLWIEANAQGCKSITAMFDPFLKDGRLALKQSLVTAESINTLIRSADVGGEIDLLSIDIDFNDYWVWKAIEVVKPRVVVIEYNAGLHPPLSLTVPYQPNAAGDGSNFFGASLEALVRLGRSKGYRVVGCNISGSNAFFVRADLCADHFIEPATSEEHYEPPRHFFSFLLAGPQAPKPGPYVAV
ncbi:MAG: hypothetical protein E6G97_01970 [Alphaproteobacteria bacterium]|nr:MAG: hypothetical protein E6G97_01970 [Alphaproteobacteria bacterium]